MYLLLFLYDCLGAFADMRNRLYRDDYMSFSEAIGNFILRVKSLMTFKGYLYKGDYVIRVCSSKEGSFKIEYTNDNWKTKEFKEYNSRYDFLKAMELRFLSEELKTNLE